MNINMNLASSASQNERIRAWLEGGNTLTALEALNLFDCMRLPSRINDLRKIGVPITTERITLPNGKRVAKYYIAV